MLKLLLRFMVDLAQYVVSYAYGTNFITIVNKKECQGAALEQQR